MKTLTSQRFFCYYQWWYTETITESSSCTHLSLSKRQVAQIVLDRVGYRPRTDLRNHIVLDPAADDGVFASEIIHRLYQSSLNFGFSFQETLGNIHLYESNPDKVLYLQEQIAKQCQFSSAEVPDTLITNADFLLSGTHLKYDLIVGTPPYIKYRYIPQKKKAQYHTLLKNFTVQDNLCLAFYQKGLEVLKVKGKLSFICSDLWLERDFKSLCKILDRTFKFTEIIDLVNNPIPSDNELDANPVITIITHAVSGQNGCYSTLTDIQQLDSETTCENNWFTTHLQRGLYYLR
ncbi:MAG: Eco57I restriction-modification methylase domain-containing protein [Owenweeksia sp.]